MVNEHLSSRNSGDTTLNSLSRSSGRVERPRRRHRAFADAETRVASPRPERYNQSWSAASAVRAEGGG